MQRNLYSDLQIARNTLYFFFVVGFLFMCVLSESIGTINLTQKSYQGVIRLPAEQLTKQGRVGRGQGQGQGRQRIRAPVMLNINIIINKFKTQTCLDLKFHTHTQQQADKLGLRGRGRVGAGETVRLLLRQA